MWNCENMKLWKYENVGRTLGIGCFHISTLSHLHIATKSLIALTVSIFAYFPNSAIAQAVVVQAHPGDEYVPPKSPLVREKLEWFRDQKLCLMMHFGLYSIWGITESWPLATKDAFWARANVEWTKDDTEFKQQYFALNKCFNPVRFNGKEIAKTAKRCGFRYVAFTTKHHDGFCLWDTKLTDYKITAPECPYSSNPNADIVKNLFDACRSEGLGISAYFSKPDWHHEDFWEGHGIGIRTDRYPSYDAAKNPEKWARFREFTKGQILELVRDCGPIDMLWLDGSWIRPSRGCDLGMTDIIAAAREIQPDLISVDRGQMDENMNIRTPEQTVPEKPLDYPWESCITMSDGWGYHYDDTYKSVRVLIHMLIDVVAKGGNLALNVGPMPDGRLPRPALERMEAMGKWLAKNGDAIYGTRAASIASIRSWRFTRGKDGRVFAIRRWNESDAGRVGVFLNVDAKQGDVVRVRHLASGLDIPFVESDGDTRGVILTFPEGFVRDKYADAFEVEYRR